jgi:3-deoxy-D-manno-octulosonate 8-phosphate phosphatase (KDO 8-P phosphatase)
MYISRHELIERMKRVKLFAVDVDGVLTDDGIYFGPDGMEWKKFHISDGFFMQLAQRSGLPIAIVSGRYSKATNSRMADLGIAHVLQGKKDKVAMIEPLLAQLNMSFADVAFVGNELLDIKLAGKVGLPLCVGDAVPALKKVCVWETQKHGGHGAVRELLEIWFEAVGRDPMEFVP